MKLRLLGLTLICLAAAAPGHAGTQRYYYDGVGRVIGTYDDDDWEQARRSDNASNPSYLHVFPIGSPSAQDTLSQYGALLADQSLTSQNGQCTLTVQDSGNVVITQGSSQVWATNTSGNQPGYFAMGGQGQLYLNSADDNNIWNSGNSQFSGAHAQLGNDCVLRIYNGSSVAWQS